MNGALLSGAVAELGFLSLSKSALADSEPQASVSGSVPQKNGATRPSLDVQYVSCFKRHRKSQVARNTVCQAKKNTKQLLTILEATLRRLGVTGNSHSIGCFQSSNECLEIVSFVVEVDGIHTQGIRSD